MSKRTKKFTPSEDHLDKMAEGRRRARIERDEAMGVLDHNSQITNTKFWQAVDPEVAEHVRTAIQKATAEQKRAELNKIRAREAELEAELGQSETENE